MVCFEIMTEIFCLLVQNLLALFPLPEGGLRALVFSKHRAGLSH